MVSYTKGTEQVFKGKFSYFRYVKVPTTAIKRYRRRAGVKSQQKNPYSKLEECITSTYATVPTPIGCSSGIAIKL